MSALLRRPCLPHARHTVAGTLSPRASHPALCAGPRTHMPRRIVALRATNDEEVARLTDLVLEAEGKLAALFEPGKPMPKASVVAKVRDQIADLKSKLAALMSGADPGSVLPEQGAEEVAAKTRQAFIEIERNIEVKYNRSAKQADDSAEIALLEAENVRLRYEAQALLSRQQQLEDFLAQIEHANDLDKAAFNSNLASSVASDFVGASVIAEMQRSVMGGSMDTPPPSKPSASWRSSS